MVKKTVSNEPVSGIANLSTIYLREQGWLPSINGLVLGTRKRIDQSSNPLRVISPHSVLPRMNFGIPVNFIKVRICR